MKATLFLFAMLFSMMGFAQMIPQIGDIPDYFTTKQKETLINNKNLLLKQKDLLVAHAAQLKAKCGNVPETDVQLNNECKAEQAKVQKEKEDLIDVINKFNNSILSEMDSFFAFKEQNNLNENFGAWYDDQKNKVQLAVKTDSDWTKECINTINGFGPLESSFQPKGLKDFKNGDVLLMFPKTRMARAIDWVNKFYNGYRKDEELQSSHALVFIGRDAAGRCLFLNNTPKSYLSPDDNIGGPHIIGQTEFEQMYGQTDYYVARPRDIVDGKKLVSTALEMHITATKNISLLGSSYGVLGNDIVCSQASDIVVAKATGRQTIDKNKFIDVTPNNFFDYQDVGRYYIISPIIKQK